jgi:hypothetical protein
MQIQRNASIEPNPETARCMCHLYGTGPALLRNSCTGTMLNAAQSTEVDVAMLPAVLAKNASTRGSQVNIQGDTTFKPILPSMMKAMLNQQHAAVFEQQRPLLAEFEQCINCQRATMPRHYHLSSHLLQFVGKDGPRNILRRPKEGQNQYCCHSYLRYMVKKQNPFKPQVMGKPPNMVIVNVPDQARTIPPVGYNFIILYVPSTIIQLLLLSKII